MSSACQIPEAEGLRGDLEFIQKKEGKGSGRRTEDKSGPRKNGKEGVKKQGSLLASPRTHHLLPQRYGFGQSTSVYKVTAVRPQHRWALGSV